MKAVFLALDMGTSSARSAIYDAKGRRLMTTTAQAGYPLVTAPDGRAELDPGDLARAVNSVFKKTLESRRNLKSPLPIAAVGVSCFWHGLMGLDACGLALTPIYTWADSRSRKEAILLRRHGGEQALHRRTGCMARTSFWPAKLLWLRRNQPRLFRKVARWVSPGEWIQESWCGTATVSLSMASGTGLLDGRTLRWHPPLLRRCGLDESRIHSISDAPTLIPKARARRFFELAGVPWYPAIGDGAAGNLGSDAVAPGVAAINVGTSAALRLVLNAKPRAHAPLAPLGLFAYRIDDRRRLIGGAVSNAGNLHGWAMRELNLPADPLMREKFLSARPGPVEKLTLLPFWIAERAPGWPEELPSAVVGITQATGAIDLLQALEEATYHRLAQIAEMIEGAAKKRLSFIVSGGILNSPSALQRLANVLGRPVYASPEPEASLRGAACFVLQKFCLKPFPLRLKRAIRPRLSITRAYAQARRQQIQLETWVRNSPFR